MSDAHTVSAGSPAAVHGPAIARLRGLLAQQPIARADAFARGWRAEQGLIAALPPRYGQVIESLLSRFESAAMFGEESCSFSQTDLIDSLALWLDKAQAQLKAAP